MGSLRPPLPCVVDSVIVAKALNKRLATIAKCWIYIYMEIYVHIYIYSPPLAGTVRLLNGLVFSVAREKTMICLTIPAVLAYGLGSFPLQILRRSSSMWTHS